MKHNYARMALLLVFFIAGTTQFSVIASQFSSSTFSQLIVSATGNNSTNDDPNFIVTLSKNGGNMDAHVSFNGTEGSRGTVKIINANNQLVNQNEITLNHAPDFSVINLTEFVPGVYTFELTTANSVHITHLTID